MVTETNATLTTEIGTTTNVSVTPAFTTSATSNVVITSTPAEATTITTRTIYTQTTGNNNAGGTNMSVIGGIIGGIGGVVLIVFLFVVVICFRRRRRDRDSGELRFAPGKDELENAQARNRNQYVPDPTFQVSHENTLDYVNITKGGECNEQTDPSVGPDGYLKKTALLISSEKSKNKQRKGHSVNATEDSSQDMPIYGNEDIVGQAAERQNSVPYDQAPPPPDLEKSASYVTGRVGPSPEKVHEKDKRKEQKGYVNLKGHKKGGPVFGVLPRHQKHKKKKNTDKMYVNERPGQQTTTSDDITSEEYYNTKDSKNTDKHYQNTKAQTQEILTQDDVYENP